MLDAEGAGVAIESFTLNAPAATLQQRPQPRVSLIIPGACGAVEHGFDGMGVSTVRPAGGESGGFLGAAEGGVSNIRNTAYFSGCQRQKAACLMTAACHLDTARKNGILLLDMLV